MHAEAKTNKGYDLSVYLGIAAISTPPVAFRAFLMSP